MRWLSTSVLLFFVGCGSAGSDWCEERTDDGDCDGVPDDWDQCSETPADALTDSRGCSATQTAGCTVQALSPEEGAVLESPARFRWSGSCEVWLLQFSEDPSFPAGATRTVVRTTDKQVEAEGSEGYWRVVGGNHGVSAGATSPPRQIGRWR